VQGRLLPAFPHARCTIQLASLVRLSAPAGYRNRVMKTGIFPLLVVLVSLAIPVGAAERNMMQPLVPADKLVAARALASPLPNSPKIIEQGKTLYRGKGACFNCHGTDGDGKGPLAAQLDPLPRNFQQPGFWRHRTEGEIFWVIKYGSVGTSMVGFDGQLTDEEIWSLIQYVRSFAGEPGPG
jgi:mono/diheme cytochrome c family protein